jgi:hypothetical protein
MVNRVSLTIVSTHAVMTWMSPRSPSFGLFARIWIALRRDIYDEQRLTIREIAAGKIFVYANLPFRAQYRGTNSAKPQVRWITTVEGHNGSNQVRGSQPPS